MLKFTLCNGVNSGRHFFQHLECWECSKTDLSISWQAFFWKRESPLFMMFCQTGNLCQWRLQIWIAWVLVWDFRCRCFFGDWMTEVGKRIWVLRRVVESRKWGPSWVWIWRIGKIRQEIVLFWCCWEFGMVLITFFSFYI